MDPTTSPVSATMGRRRQGPHRHRPQVGSVTAGSSARGDQLALMRNRGYLVNRYGLPGMNDAGPMGIQPIEGLYLGTIHIDGSAGQVTCHRSWGRSRKWGVWNFYNRKAAIGGPDDRDAPRHQRGACL